MEQSNRRASAYLVVYAASVTVRAPNPADACKVAQQAMTRVSRHRGVRGIEVKVFTVERVAVKPGRYRTWDLAAIVLVVWLLSLINWWHFWN